MAVANGHDDHDDAAGPNFEATYRCSSEPDFGIATASTLRC